MRPKGEFPSHGISLQACVGATKVFEKIALGCLLKFPILEERPLYVPNRVMLKVSRLIVFLSRAEIAPIMIHDSVSGAVGNQFCPRRREPWIRPH